MNELSENQFTWEVIGEDLVFRWLGEFSAALYKAVVPIKKSGNANYYQISVAGIQVPEFKTIEDANYGTGFEMSVVGDWEFSELCTFLSLIKAHLCR